MRKTKIYLAGKMSGISFDESNEWRMEFKKAMQFYAPSPCIVINPNDYYNFKNPTHKSEKEVMQYDLNHVRNSDVVVVNLEGLNTSIGTAIEMFLAAENNIPIIALDTSNCWEYMHPWLKECISRTENSVAKLCRYIADYYIDIM